MTQSITQLFQSSGPSGKNMPDDGGYTKPLGGAGGTDHFGVSHENDFGGDFAKVDFDKPLFGGGKDSNSGDGQPMPRSLYSSSSSAK